MLASRLTAHFLRPVRGGAAGVVIVFALLSWIAGNAGLIGIPLGLIVSSWFFKYAFILFDHVVRGVDEPPTLDISMMNPLDEQRPLAQLAIVLVVVALVKVLSVSSPLAAGALGLASLLCLPASVAVLGLEGNLLKAVYPMALGHLIVGLSWLYAVVLGVIAGDVLLLGLIAKLPLWQPIETAAGLFAILSVFSGLGGVLYERRHELGLETWHSPERAADKERLAAHQDDEKLVTEAYGQVRVGEHAKAFGLLVTWLNSRGASAKDYRWLMTRLATWPDPRYATRMAEEYVETTLGSKRLGDALDAVRDRVKVDAAFRPKTAASTVAVARLAAQGGGAKSLARMLLKDFGDRFPGDKLIAVAEGLARHLGE